MPIIGRGGLGIQPDYSAVQAVYKSSANINEAGKQKTIDLQVAINSAATYYGGSETTFAALIGQEFVVYNPEYQFDSSQPVSWRFKFVSDVGIDPRLVYQKNGLYPGYPGRQGNSFNANLHTHLLKPVPRQDYHHDFEQANPTALEKYGKSATDSNGAFYEIPVGLDTVAFPSGQKSSLLTSATDIPIANFDMTTAVVFQRLASNPYWLYAVITRSLYQVLPSYISLLDPDGTNHPNVNKETGAYYLWDVYDLSSMTTAAAIRIKMKHARTGAIQNPSSNIVSSNSDLILESWDFSVPHEWTRSGYRKIERQDQVFYEDFRTDFLKQTELRPIDGQVATIQMYSPQDSQGTTTPQFTAGVEISKYEEKLSNTAAPINEIVTSELLSIRKTQKRELISNTNYGSHTYYEDVHYVDPDGQTHSQLENKRAQWVNIADHGNNSQAAFVAHLENMFDNRYSPTRLIEETPMSGRIDPFDRVQSFYTCMPETVLWNTRKSVSAQSFDLESITIVKDKYLKKSEQIAVKKFEDLKGIRDEGEEEYHIIRVKTSGQVHSMAPNPPGQPASIGTLPAGNYRSYHWKYDSSGNIKFEIRYKGGVARASFPATSPNFPSQNTPTSDWIYLKRVPTVSPGESIMFEDYFDQEDPDVLDYVEEEKWSRIDGEMMVWLTKKYWDNDNNPSTIDVLTGRSIEIDQREWQQSDYLYTNTGHTAVHSSRVNGIIAQEHKR